MLNGQLFGDSRANASFAFAAVIILLSVSALSGIVLQMENANREMAKTDTETEIAAEIARIVTTECGFAIQAASNKLLGAKVQKFNLSEFERDLKIELEKHFSSRYPMKIGSIRVNISLANLTAIFSNYESNRSENDTLPGSILATAIMQVSAHSERINYRTKIEITKEIKTPMPFFATQIGHIDRSAKSGGQLGRTVRNTLMQLAQLRVMQGYGAPGHPEKKSVRNIITAEDVEIAVNLALQLMTLSDFRTIDSDAWDALLSEACADEKFSIYSDWFRNEVDPFKTFMMLRQHLLSLGVNQRDFSVQILYSIIDKIVLRYLSYLNIIDIAEVIQTAKVVVGETWKSLIHSLTGVDARLEEAQQWVCEKLSAIGMPESLWKNLFENPSDLTLECNLTYVYIFDRYGRLTPVAIGSQSMSMDLPNTSLIESDAWKSYYPNIASHAISVGEDIEVIVTSLCMDIARNIQSKLIFGSMSSSDSYIISTLDALKDEIQNTNQEVRANPDSYSQLLACDKTLLDLREFVNSSWDKLFNTSFLVDSTLSALAMALSESAVVSNPSDFPDGWKDEVRAVIRNELDGGYLSEWNNLLKLKIDALSKEYRSAVIGILNYASTQPCETEGTVPKGLMKLILSGIIQRDLVNGVDEWIGLLKLQLRNMTSELRLDENLNVSSNAFIELRKNRIAENEEASARVFIAPTIDQNPRYLHSFEITPAHDYDLSNVDPFDRLCVIIESPVSHYSGKKSIHYTSLDFASSFPFENNWLIKARGLVELKITDGFGSGQCVKENVLIDLAVPITAISGWALEEVRYESSNTLVGDAWALLMEIKNKIWEFISPLLELFGDAFRAIYDAFSQLSRYISGFVEKLTKLFFDIGCWITSVIKDVVDWIRGSPFWKFIEIAIDAFGKLEIKFEYGPFAVIVGLSLPDLLFRKAKDLLRIIFILHIGELGLAWGFRIAKLANGFIDIIANSTIRYGRSLRIDLLCDPLMEIKDHFFEIEVVWDNLKLMIWSPEIDDYRKTSIELKDVPGLGAVLSNIPIPALGVSVSINAGLMMKYRLPLCDQLVINEVELNPTGTDSGKEWIEIYNPLDRVIELEGYFLETMHGEIATLELDGFVPARGYRVFTFAKNALDNGDPGDSFAFGDSIALVNAEGNVIDMTPIISDTASNSDTWHRSWDGSPKWVFGINSKGTSNGNPLIHTYPDILSKLCVDALILALKDEANNVSASLDFVTNVFRSFLVELIDVSAEFIASLVHEVALFFEFGVNDISGTAGIGVRIKLSFGEEFVKFGVLWFIEQITKMISNLFLGSPISPNLLAQSRPLESIYIGADFYARIGTPRMLSVLFDGASIPNEIRIALTISLNLAALGPLFGCDWGRFKIVFGVHIDDLPGMKLMHPLTIRREKVDLWLLKGTLSMVG